jgi:hypothetical protein
MRALVLTPLVLAMGCLSPERDFESGPALPVKDSCGVADPSSYFVSSFDITDPKQAGAAAVYMQVLSDAREPSLGCGADIGEGYRVVWPPRSLQSNGFIVRVTREGRERTLVTTNLTTDGKYFQPSPKSTRTIESEEWAELTKPIYDLDMQLNTIPPQKALLEDPVVLDGHAWLFEERRNSRYRAIVVTFPREQTFRGALTALVKLAKRDLPGEIVTSIR